MQMKGTLVVNHMLAGEKYRSQDALYLAAAKRLGVSLTVRTNAEPVVPDSDFVLFLDKDILLARSLELQGFRVYNRASAIAWCDDKAWMYLRLRQSGIRMPHTMIVPMTFFAADWSENPFLDRAGETLGYPMIVKETHGSFGKQVWLVQNRAQLVERLNASSPAGMILQEFIPSSRGRDIRIQFVGGKPVACMYRWSDTDFRANLSSGGSMRPYVPTEGQQRMAADACCALGLDFGGVDLLFDDVGDPILCEVNSNAHIRNLLACTGVDVAEAILSHIRADVCAGTERVP